MGKKNLGWLRQKPVGFTYGEVWCCLLGAIAFLVGMTLWIIRVQVDKEHVCSAWGIYFFQLLFPVLGNVLGQIISCKRKSWRQSRSILTVRLILIAAFLLAYALVVLLPNGIGAGFYVGKGTSELGLVSTQEVFFVMTLFEAGALFQSVLIEFEGRQEETNKVIGGTLIIMGIVMPELLKSWSLLGVYCGEGSCTPDQLEVFVLFKMGIACAVGLSAMFVVGLFSETIIGFIRSSAEGISNAPQESSLTDSQNSEVPVSASENATASDTQNDGVELVPVSSPVATGMSQGGMDGVPTSAHPKETLASACGSGGAVSKQLMSVAAVSGLVAGVCVSVVSRLFGRR